MLPELEIKPAKTNTDTSIGLLLQPAAPIVNMEEADRFVALIVSVLLELVQICCTYCGHQLEC